ncbi:cupin domain-containing protein [Zobellella maritima]|uniref:cupin domain-containing protein n=1 Tax=Zobellella maritima TaxID=2059725 RepID=UPI000E308BED|nr:cupin domain-containing protein [Zobellella maritima]
MIPHNLGHDIPPLLPEELIQTLAGNDQVRIERIVSRGHASPEGFWYDQDEHEFVLLVQGEAELELRSPAARIRLQAGDYLLLSAHRQHRVSWTHPGQDTVWLAVFYPPAAAAGGTMAP